MSFALIPLFAGLVLLCLALAPLLDTQLLFFDLSSHFPLQAALGAAVILLLCLPWWKRWAVRWGMVTLLFAAVGNGAWLYPNWISESGLKIKGTPDLIIAELNVQTSNRDFEATIAWLQRNKHDVFVAVEVDRGWLNAFSTLSAQYPHHRSNSRDDNFGLAVYSRFPIVQSHKIKLPVVPVPAYFLRLDVRGRAVRLAAIHTVPPLSQNLLLARNESLKTISQWVAEEPGTPSVVIGDLNSAPFAAPFREFLNRSGLSDSRLGQGMIATWPSYFPSAARVPIDYILNSRHMRTLELKVGYHVGSDHLPLLGKFVFVK